MPVHGNPGTLIRARAAFTQFESVTFGFSRKELALELGIVDTRIDGLVDEFKRFVAVALATQGAMPSRSLDGVWHRVLVDPQFCRLVHSNPIGTLQHLECSPDEIRKEETRLLVERAFPALHRREFWECAAAGCGDKTIKP